MRSFSSRTFGVASAVVVASLLVACSGPQASNETGAKTPAPEREADGPPSAEEPAPVSIETETFAECRRIEDGSVGRIYICERAGFVGVVSTAFEWTEDEQREGLADFAEGVVRSIYAFGGEFRFKADTVAFGDESRTVLRFDASEIEGLDTEGGEFTVTPDPDGVRVVGCATLSSTPFGQCERVLKLLSDPEEVAALDIFIDAQPVVFAGRSLEVPDSCEQLDSRTIRCSASELSVAPVVEPNLIAAEATLQAEQKAQFERNCRNGYDFWDAVCAVDAVPTNCYVAVCREQGHAQVAAMASVRDQVIAVSCRFNAEKAERLPPVCMQVLGPNEIVQPPSDG